MTAAAACLISLAQYTAMGALSSFSRHRMWSMAQRLPLQHRFRNRRAEGNKRSTCHSPRTRSHPRFNGGFTRQLLHATV
jgi:hypothetical protein